MAEKGVIVVDFEGVESGGGRPKVPESDYALKLKTIKQKTGEESQKPYLDCGFELSQGPKKGNGKVIQHSFSLQKKSLWNLKNFLEATGKQVPSKALKITLSKLVGLECAGTVIDDAPYENKIKSVISAFFPLADLGSTSDGDELEEAGEEVEEEVEEKPATKTGKKKVKKSEPEDEVEEEAEEEELFS